MGSEGQENVNITLGCEKSKPADCQQKKCPDGTTSLIVSLDKSFAELDIKTNEDLQTSVKKIVKDLFTRRAVSLKAEIQEEMDTIEKDLEGYVRRMKIIRESISKLDARLVEVKAQGDTKGTQDLEKEKIRLVEIKQSILDGTTLRENRMQELLDSWDYFRTGFKDKILETIRAEIKRMDEEDDKWDPNNPLSWAHYLPDFMKKTNIDYSTAAPYFP